MYSSNPLASCYSQEERNSWEITESHMSKELQPSFSFSSFDIILGLIRESGDIVV